MIAFDNGAFLQYFGTQPDLAVELNEALNATGESTAPLVHKWCFQYLSAYHLMPVEEANVQGVETDDNIPVCLFVRYLWVVVT